MEICIWSFSDLLALHHNLLKVSASLRAYLLLFKKTSSWMLNLTYFFFKKKQWLWLHYWGKLYVFAKKRKEGRKEKKEKKKEMKNGAEPYSSIWASNWNIFA